MHPLSRAGKAESLLAQVATAFCLTEPAYVGGWRPPYDSAAASQSRGVAGKCTVAKACLVI
jgi:hypothetical protein